MYYLQSRYYDPAIGRFINADIFASTGYGIVGCNMYAYCNNDPVNCSDPSGYILGEIAFFLGASGILFAGLMLATLFELNMVQNSLNALNTAINKGVQRARDTFSSTFNSIVGNTSKNNSAVVDVPSIAGKYGNFKCDIAAEAIQNALMKNRQHGNLVTIQYPGLINRNNVWSDIQQRVISNNGFHCGIEYNGLVYCNVHPYGLPYEEWISDFKGFGIPIIQTIPF